MVGCVQQLRQKLNATQMQFHIPPNPSIVAFLYDWGKTVSQPTLAELCKLADTEEILLDRRGISAMEFYASAA